MNAQQAVWQHYHFAHAQLVDSKIRVKGASAEPLQHRTLYQRLQNMGRQVRKAPNMDHLAKSCLWQPVLVKDDEKEGLGLSEM